MSRLIIVSHRLPYSGSLEKGALALQPSPGGLASGLLPLLKEKAMWIGWDGLHQKLGKSEKKAVEDAFQQRGCSVISLPQRPHRAFYNDISNGIFWPLYHNQTGRLPLQLPHWSDYQLINRLFADRVAKIAQAGDTVWIHDYHLQLLPRMLRERNLDVSIAFFLHIPFPPAEIFRMLPMREEILEGLLAADVIGFHSVSHMNHFKQAAESIASYPRVADGLLVDGRRVRVLAAPLGIEGGHWGNLAQSEASGPLFDAIRRERAEHPERQIILSVDRLDYTKGLLRKLLAVERLLERHPECLGQITFMQIAPSSRGELATYGHYKLQVEQLVSSINGKFGFPGYQPIYYYSSAFPAEELAQAYRHVQVMLVTPLIDGMNLVAKEFVASRTDEGGVLILSEFAGAAEELSEACIVNPYDIEGVVDALHEALHMPQEERRDRMRSLREEVMRFSVKDWVRNFFQGEGSTAPAPVAREADFLSFKELPALVERIKPPLALFIDYDGTLFPIVRRPELALPDSSLIMLLGRLCHTPGIEVHLISGRSFEELLSWFHRLPLHIHGDHGGISYDPRTRKRSFLKDPRPTLPIMQSVDALFERYGREHKGVLIEKKAFSTVFHYRMAEVASIVPALERLKAEISTLEGVEEIDILLGKKNIEVRRKGINKSHVIRARLQSDDRISCVAIGDDKTDEDMFRAIEGRGMTLSVGSTIADADFRLRDCAMVREFLRLLEARFRRERQGSALSLSGVRNSGGE